jgi:hypothetical protein
MLHTIGRIVTERDLLVLHILAVVAYRDGYISIGKLAEELGKTVLEAT